MRMSRAVALFIVVEGKELDAPFYDSLAASSPTVRAGGYQVWLVEQITRGQRSNGPTSGKKAVLDLYDFYRRKRNLALRNSFGRRSIVFCIDRDNDDVSGAVRTGPHVVYTEMYDAEAHVFANADFVPAIAKSAFLDRETTEDFLRAHPDWLGSFANAWREWITLCCLAKAVHARSSIGFRQQNRVNTARYGPVDDGAVAAALTEITARSPCSAEDFTRIERIVRRRIKKIYESGSGVRLVRGKWLPVYLGHLLAKYLGNTFVHNGFETRAVVAFLSHVDFSQPWATYFRRRFEQILS